MKISKVAERYARALFSLNEGSAKSEEILAQLGQVVQAFTRDEETLSFISSPLYRPADKIKVIEALVAAIPMADTLKNFLIVCARKNRLSHLADIARAFAVISDENRGISRGTVRSATVLGPEERQQLTERLGQVVGKQIVLSFEEDPGLLGGMVAEVGRFTFDDSLRSQLNRIQDQIIRSA